MKKTLVAAGIIVALGVVWTTGAWYTGKQLEGRLAQMVSEANAQIKRNAPQANLELTTQDYQRGVFSSQFTVQVKNVAGSESPWLKQGQSVVLHEKVDHGPFPLAQLKSLNLIPAMASVHTTLVNNDVSKPLFDIAQGNSPFYADTRIGYGGDTQSDITLRPLNSDKNGEKVAFSGGEFRLKADKDGNAVSLDGEVESALIEAVNEYGQKVRLTFNNLKTEGATELSPFDERVGKQQMRLDKLAIAIENKELAVLEGMDLNAKSDVADDKKHINSQLDYTLDSAKIQGQEFGSGKLTLKVGQIDGNAWHQFSQQYNEQTRALLAQPEVMQNPELYQQRATEAFLSAVPLLLKGDPVITIAPLSWKNAKGESTFNLSLFLRDPSTATTAPQTLSEEVDRSVKSLDSKLIIPMDMATELMTQVARIEGYQQEDAQKLASQQVKGFAAMGKMFHLTSVEDNNVTSTLQYANGQVTLNGEKMPLEQFIGLFGFMLPQPQPQPSAPPVTPFPQP